MLHLRADNNELEVLRANHRLKKMIVESLDETSSENSQKVALASGLLDDLKLKNETFQPASQ